MRNADKERITRLQDRLDADWQAALHRENGKIVGDERNILHALRSAPELCKLLRFDSFALNVELTRPAPWRDEHDGVTWTDRDDTQLAAWLQAQGIAVRGVNVVTDCVAVVAQENRVHPVRDYLSSIKWDGKPRLSSWLVTYFHAEGDAHYLAAVGRCWPIAAVARVQEPGCKADCALVLESRQGERKSSAAACLAVRPEWFADSVGDLRNKDSAIQLCGKWIVELAELAAVRRAEIEAVKSYLSRTHDVYRPPYGRRAVTVPRQCVFLGTTNEGQYLRDRTGNRRYWPVRCADIDLVGLRRDRDLLWAEAVDAYRRGEPWYLTAAQEALAASEQEERLQQTELECVVAEYLERRAADNERTVTTRDVFVWALHLDPDSDKYAEQTARLGVLVAAAIEKAGWSRVGRKGKGDAKRTLYELVGPQESPR